MIVESKAFSDSSFERVELDARHSIYTGRLPDHLTMDAARFEAVWAVHPAERHEIRVHYRLVKTPRWQQAYGRDYVFSGTQSSALPIPDAFADWLEWSRASIDPRLNGLLLNWYDGKLGHYISAHRDSRRKLVPGSPIVTMSFGEQRSFRFRPYRGKGFRDFAFEHGRVFVVPYETNLAWTHEVPHFAGLRGRRISVTVRAFEDR